MYGVRRPFPAFREDVRTILFLFLRVFPLLMKVLHFRKGQPLFPHDWVLSPVRILQDGCLRANVLGRHRESGSEGHSLFPQLRSKFEVLLLVKKA